MLGPHVDIEPDVPNPFTYLHWSRRRRMLQHHPNVHQGNRHQLKPAGLETQFSVNSR